MTTADPKLETIERVKVKYAAKLERKGWSLDNEAGVKRLADAVIVGEKEQKNSCALFAAGGAVLVIVAGIVAVIA